MERYMKAFFIYSVLFLLNIQTGFLPKADLLIIMGIALVLDFLTGVVKAVFKGTKRTSMGYRKTIIKFIQYGSAIMIGMGISYLGTQIEEYNKGWANVSKYMNWFNNGLLILIILIEITSIFENIYELNRKSKFSRYVINPALKILTVQIKNNPMTKVSFVTDDDDAEVEITEEKITSKNIVP